MRWFQVDSDTPHDPRVLGVVLSLGNEGLGGLFRLWCHIANHGERKPGWSLNTAGKPMPKPELVYASGLTDSQFDQLVSICIENGHFVKREWVARSVIAIPAMYSRADTYTKRRVRTRVEPASKNVLPQDSTRQDITSKNPLTPYASAQGARVTRKMRKRAEEILRIRFGECKHEPKCANSDVCVSVIARDLLVKSSAA